jgi:hypothetical protein
MLLLVVSLPLGLLLTADRPGVTERAGPAPAVRRGTPAPRQSAPAVHVRLRARAPEREEDPSRAGSDATDAAAPPPAADHWCRGAPFAPEPSPAALIYALCTLLC